MNRVTALIPIRNGEEYLSSAINSLESNQDCLERIIVMEDGSTDSTLARLQEWARDNSKVSVIQTKGVGLVKSLNLGISETTTNWIARFDVDDLYVEDRVAKQVELITPKSVAIFSDYNLFSDKFGSLGLIPSAITPAAMSLSLRKNQRTPHPSVMFNVAAVRSVGGYRESDFPAEDYSLWLRLNKIGEISSVGEALLQYRISGRSISGLMRREMSIKSAEILKAIGVPHLGFEEAENIFSSTASEYIGLNDADLRLLLHFIDLNSALSPSALNRALSLKFLAKHVQLLKPSWRPFKFGSMVLKRKLVRYLL
jgi:hypothetical protein